MPPRDTGVLRQDGDMPDTRTATSRVDGSMSLLVDMPSVALDPAYAEVAARKARGELPAPLGRRRPALLLLVLLLAGLVTGIGAAQVRRDAARESDVRTSLATEVRRETRATDALDRQAAALRTRVDRARAQALGSDGQGQLAAARLRELETVTGTIAVRGPALVVTLDDAPDGGAGAAPRGGQAGDGRVFDRDLQDVVNSLWFAGAEAISVNDQRLTAQTAIRSAGEAILVDFRPLSPPYVLRAIGDVDQLQASFVDSATARRLQTLTSLYGLRFALSRVDAATLPGTAAPNLRSVEAGTTP